MAGPIEAQPPDLSEVLHDLAVKIDRVKQLYEMYFSGIEKVEPTIPRKEITRAMILQQQQYIRNTGLRFRFQTMLQKWNIYVTYWNRTLREIEAGTYVRHIQRARRHAQREGKEIPKELLPPAQRPGSDPALKKIHDWDSHPGLLTDGPARPHDSGTGTTIPVMGGRDSLLPALDSILPRSPAKPPPPPVRPLSSVPPPPPHASAPPPPPFKPAPSAREVTNPKVALPPPRPSIPGMNENELRALHKQFVDARRAAGEAASVSYDALVSTLAKQVPRVLEAPGAKGVKFEVATQNGKAILKAYPTK